jgi:uncharacterized SAM-binding protein YcdF (DUF218 family)
VLHFFLSQVLVPPGLGYSLLVGFGLALWFDSGKKIGRRGWLRFGFIASFLLSVALSTRIVGEALIYQVEGVSLKALSLQELSAKQASSNAPGAIVILGGGLKTDPRELPYEDTPHHRTLIRLQYGAYLAKKANLPVLVTGGITPTYKISEAEVMGRVLSQDYGVTPKWLEPNSLDTADNARESARILKAQGISTIVLVTQAFHMRRSALAFEAQGMTVIKAPCGFLGGLGAPIIRSWLPSASGVELTFQASHEIIGLLLYRARGLIASFG